jgi:ribose transport system permease protein
MKNRQSGSVVLRLLENMPILLLVAVFAVFSILDERFFDPQTLVNIGRQASYVGILAVGMTFVLLTAGIDLSVGSIAYLSAVVMSHLLKTIAFPIWGIALSMAVIGLVCGLLSGAVSTWFRIIPFVVTLAAMGIYRGMALGISQSREADYPMVMTELGNAGVFGIPLPIIIFALVVLVAHIVLTRTTYGRQLYAVGQDRDAAERAGIPTRRILWSVYLISGALAGLAAFNAVIQLGTVVPSFGVNDEFDAIAAAVLGGASLFGGRGSVFPGTVAGTLLVQMITVGLVFIQVDLYMTPMISALVILLAVLLDTIRTRMLDRLARRSIRMEAAGADAGPEPASAR